MYHHKQQAPTNWLKHYVWSLTHTHRREIEEENKAINHDWVYTVAWYPCYNQLFDLFELITKIRFYNNSLEFIN